MGSGAFFSADYGAGEDSRLREDVRLSFWFILAVSGAIYLATLLGFASDTDPIHSHPNRCTGDCFRCPSHYGYRYGRWYYGHHHTHGCEFGGTDCSGKM